MPSITPPNSNIQAFVWLLLTLTSFALFSLPLSLFPQHITLLTSTILFPLITNFIVGWRYITLPRAAAYRLLAKEENYVKAMKWRPVLATPTLLYWFVFAAVGGWWLSFEASSTPLRVEEGDSWGRMLVARMHCLIHVAIWLGVVGGTCWFCWKMWTSRAGDFAFDFLDHVAEDEKAIDRLKSEINADWKRVMKTKRNEYVWLRRSESGVKENGEEKEEVFELKLSFAEGHDLYKPQDESKAVGGMLIMTL